jgi:hypothetical protein
MMQCLESCFCPEITPQTDIPALYGVRSMNRSSGPDMI